MERISDIELNDWFNHLPSDKVEEALNCSLFDYMNEEEVDEQGNCNFEVFYAKTSQIWNTLTYEEKIKIYQKF